MSRGEDEDGVVPKQKTFLYKFTVQDGLGKQSSQRV